MNDDPEVERSLLPTDQASGSNSIRKRLNNLQASGEYLVKELTSEISDEFFVELEMNINVLYNALDAEAISKNPHFRVQSLNALMDLIDTEISPFVNEWSKFVKLHPNGPRPRDVFVNIKTVGKKIRNLHRSI